MSKQTRFTRREFLRLSGTAAVASLVAACAGGTPTPQPTQAPAPTPTPAPKAQPTPTPAAKAAPTKAAAAPSKYKEAPQL
ncbi:MAG: ABC transporter substrate-binding protein, partial [Anaerolineae bacterium]|nr:ABC transporter substrate-binding protein [Anaerolineae bacterium]